MPEPHRRLRVLYVGGMPRSGSTLTDLLLHQLPGHVGVGELFYLWRNGVVHDHTCACGEPFSRCEFWVPVGERAFGGWSAGLAEEMMALQGRVDATSRIPLLLSPRRPARFQRDLSRYTDVLRRLYAAILEVSGSEVVVDSSKRPSLAFCLRAMPDVDLRVVQVVRDPRGVAYSFAKHVPLERGQALGDAMPRSTTRKVARRWVTVNTAIAALSRLGVPSTRLRYEDLVADPVATLTRVTELTGSGDGLGRLADVGTSGLRVPRTHVFAAGRIRMADGPVPLRLDDAWTREMPARDRRLVEVVTAPSRGRYGYR